MNNGDTIFILEIVVVGILLFMSNIESVGEVIEKTPEENELELQQEALLLHGRCHGIHYLTCSNKWNISLEIVAYKDVLEISEVMFPWERIKNAVIKTDNQIQKDISAGKILAFCRFALASKKTRTVSENYLVITYLNEFENEEDLIFTHKNSKDGYPSRALEDIKIAYKMYKQNNQENK